MDTAKLLKAEGSAAEPLPRLMTVKRLTMDARGCCCIPLVRCPEAKSSFLVLTFDEGYVAVELTEFIALAEEILEVNSGSLDLANSLDDIDWDSLANISFIAEIDARLNRSINAESLSHAETLADVFALVPEQISDAP